MYLFILAILMIATPIMISYQIEPKGISREEMLTLYSLDTMESGDLYTKRGELIARTAAWISVLIVLLSVVKNQTRKK
jgi:hypothetical protein